MLVSCQKKLGYIGTTGTRTLCVLLDLSKAFDMGYILFEKIYTCRMNLEELLFLSSRLTCYLNSLPLRGVPKMAFFLGDFDLLLTSKCARNVKSQVMLAKTKATLIQHKKCVDSDSVSFQGVTTTKKQL